MDITEIASYARRYEEILRDLKGDIGICRKEARAPFAQAYKDEIPNSAGAYVIYLPSDIIYIGKALNFRMRIWYHLKAPTKYGDSHDYVFSGSRFLNDAAFDAPAHEAIFKGQFKVDYFEITNHHLADGLEVYLQTIHFCKENRLPFGNKQFG